MKTTIIFDSYDNYELEQAKLDMVESEMYEKIEDISDEQGYDYISYLQAQNFDYFEGELSAFIDEQENPMLLIGYVGGWQRRSNGGIFVSRFGDLYTFWQHCDHIKVEEIRGRLFIECSHHDGTNRAELRQITSKGNDYMNNHLHDMSEEELHTKLYKSRNYTKNANYKKTVWG